MRQAQAQELASKEEATKSFAKELQSEHARRLADISSKLEARDQALSGKEAELEQMVTLAKEALAEVQQKRAETEERGRQALAEADGDEARRGRGARASRLLFLFRFLVVVSRGPCARLLGR